MVEDALVSMSTRTIDPNVRSSYQSLVGALLYCSTQTRPDVAFADGMLCGSYPQTTRISCINSYNSVKTYLHPCGKTMADRWLKRFNIDGVTLN
eukprot:689333-Pleurochrysis_carterae.AAC.1